MAITYRAIVELSMCNMYFVTSLQHPLSTTIMVYLQLKRLSFRYNQTLLKHTRYKVLCLI